MELRIDPIDHRILKELTEDGRISYLNLARKLKVSNTLVHQRIRKLSEKGILKKATFRINTWMLGYQTTAFTQIKISDAKIHREVEQELYKIPEIVECFNISGSFAIMVKILAKNNRHLRDILYEKIQNIEGVIDTNSIFSFETAFLRSLPE